MKRIAFLLNFESLLFSLYFLLSRTISKGSNKVVSKPVESGEMYASVASRTCSKGKFVIMETLKTQSVKEFVKEVQLIDFMAEVYAT